MRCVVSLSSWSLVPVIVVMLWLSAPSAALAAAEVATPSVTEPTDDKVVKANGKDNGKKKASKKNGNNKNGKKNGKTEAKPAIKVEVSGAPRSVQSVVEGYLEPQTSTCVPDSPLDEKSIQRAIRDALDALGYFSAEFRTSQSPTEPCLLSVKIFSSNQQAIELSKLNGWTLRIAQPELLPDEYQAWLNKRFREGKAFDPQAYETSKRASLAYLRDRGFLDARFANAVVEVDASANTTQIVWDLDTGPQYRISAIEVDQSTLNRTLFDKYLTVREGAPLYERDVLSSYENLIASEYFARVKVNPLLDQRDNGEVPVQVIATAAKPWTVAAGAGFATDTGPRLKAEADARYVNRRGHRFGSSSLVSPVIGHLNAEYRWPYENPTHQWYKLDAGVSYEDTDTAQSQQARIGLSRVTRLGKRWRQTTYTDFRHERFDISAQEGLSQLLLFGSNLTFSSVIDSARPRLGTSFGLDIKGGHRALLSDNDVLQIRFNAKQILPFLGNSRLLLRGEIGATWQAEFADLPASLRFFAGGDQSVRGFALDDLGPKDELGEVIGGERLITGSLEWDVQVRPNWSVALFTDIGSAYNSTPEFSQSVGFGVRWYSPLGPIRVDLAHPLEDSDQLVRLHISLGPDL
jgi:translocation and assembly module TamA